MDDAKQTKVIDVEIVDESSLDTVKVTASPLDELQNIQNLINSNITQIDKLQDDIKPVKEMLESVLQADLSYAELDQKVLEATKEKMAKKKELMNTTNGRELSEKMKTLKSELKEAKDKLSDYLKAYQQQTGFNEYEGPDGELRQIVFTAKLVRKTKLNWD